MNAKRFANLREQDTAALTVSAPIYGEYYDVPGKRLFVAPGTVGTIGAARVPNVTGREGYFHCLDFPVDTPLYDYKGRIVTPTGKPYRRVAIGANMIK